MIRTFGIKYATNSCTECSKDFLMVKTTGNNYMMSDLASFPCDTEFCLSFNFYFDDCLQCNPGYTLLQDHSCVSAQTLGFDEKCKGSEDSVNCFKCIKGYTVNQLNKKECLKNENLISFEQDTHDEDITYCKKGYYSNLKGVCVPIPADDVCNFYRYVNDLREENHCVACRDANKISIIISNSNDLYNKTKCIPVTHHDSYPVIQFTAVYGAKHSDFEEYGVGYDFLDIMTDSIEHYNIVELATSRFYDEQICIPEFRQELNCKEYNGSKYSCATCADGYFMDDLENCVKGTIPKCEEYSDGYHCSKCGQGYYVTGAETSLSGAHKFMKGCSKYTVDCQQYSPDKDSCIRCKSGAYMDTTTATEKYDCKPYTVPNCAVYSPGSDDCRICEPGAYLDSNGKCNPINVVNCVIYSKRSGSCLACKNGFYLENGTSL